MMKKILLYAALMCIALIACQTKIKNKPTDLASEKVVLNKIMDDYHAALDGDNPQVLSAFWTEDILYCGSDPKEFWNKTSVSKEFDGMFANKTNKTDYKILAREIRLDKDGQSALILEQISFKGFSEKIPFRLLYHAVRVSNDWKFDFISASLIPTNADAEKMKTAIN
jgi:hypothetical protein